MRMKQEIDKTFDCQDGMKRSQQASGILGFFMEVLMMSQSILRSGDELNEQLCS